MSKIDRMTTAADLLEITSANQDLFVDLNQKDAEIISGGCKLVEITNKTKYDITHVLDGKQYLMKPGEKWYFAAPNGYISFDTDGRDNYKQDKSYTLNNEGKYKFEDNNYTPEISYDLDLYTA